MLRVSLIGNCGSDPEERYSAKGTLIVSLRVAVNQVRIGPDKERQENTEWFRVRVSGRQAEFAQRLTKGSRIFAAGRLDISHFQGKDGEPRTGFDVWADDIQSFSSRQDQGRDPVENGAARQPAKAAVEHMDPDDDSGENLPF